MNTYTQNMHKNVNNVKQYCNAYRIYTFIFDMPQKKRARTHTHTLSGIHTRTQSDIQSAQHNPNRINSLRKHYAKLHSGLTEIFIVQPGRHVYKRVCKFIFIFIFILILA